MIFIIIINSECLLQVFLCKMFIYIDVIFIIILNVYFIAVNTHGSEDTSKWITPHGSTAIKLHGQTIHFLPKNSNCKNAIEFFTHQNIEILNVPSKINDLIDPNIFNVFLQEFKEHNGFAVDCVNVGNFLLDLSINDHDNEGVKDYILKEMNSRSSRFDVGSISSINPTGNRDVVYVLKG